MNTTLVLMRNMQDNGDIDRNVVDKATQKFRRQVFHISFFSFKRDRTGWNRTGDTGTGIIKKGFPVARKEGLVGSYLKTLCSPIKQQSGHLKLASLLEWEQPSFT